MLPSPRWDPLLKHAFGPRMLSPPALNHTFRLDVKFAQDLWPTRSNAFLAPGVASIKMRKTMVLEGCGKPLTSRRFLSINNNK